MRYFVLMFMFVFALDLYATPQFAKENNLQCSACHTSVPKLSSLGRTFLNNNFTFDVNATTTLQKVLNQDRNETYIPAAMVLGVNYNSFSNSVKPKIKLFTAGRLTKNLAYFVATSKAKKLYLSYKYKKSFIKAGFLSPYTSLNSIDKLSSNLGLNCRDKDQCSNLSQTPLKQAYIKPYRGIELSGEYKNF